VKATNKGDTPVTGDWRAALTEGRGDEPALEESNYLGEKGACYVRAEAAQHLDGEERRRLGSAGEEKGVGRHDLFLLLLRGRGRNNCGPRGRKKANKEPVPIGETGCLGSSGRGS